jgi:AraC-like DNA-binding protein
LTAILDGYRHLAPRFSILQDGQRLEAIDTDALVHLLDWLKRNAGMIRDRVERRIAVIPAGAPGLTLLGIQPLLELCGPLTIVTDAGDGFRALRPDDGDAVRVEIEAVIAEARGLSPALLSLRAALVASHGALDLAEAARRLGVSARSLQRELTDAGVTFRAEQAEARFRAAEELLQGDEKLVAVAARLGLSEDGLTKLVRARTGHTPGELRRTLRAAR